MNVSGINGGITPAQVTPQSGNDNSSQIKSLEQKLQQLGKEKEKAARERDEEAVKRIEKQIQEIQKQIEQLKRQGGKNQEEAEQTTAAAQGGKPKDPTLGNYIDEMV